MATPAGRPASMAIAMGIVTVINVTGVRTAIWTVDAFTVAKLLPLLVLVALGVPHIRGEIFATQAVGRA